MNPTLPLRLVPFAPGSPAQAQAAAYHRLARKLAHRTIARKGLFGELADRVHDGAIDGLFNAVRRHDPTRGKLSTYVHWNVKGYIGRALTKATTRARRELPRGVWDEATIPDPRDAQAEQDRQDDLHAALDRVRAAMDACLTPRQHETLVRLHGLDDRPPLSAAALAAEWGTTVGLVHTHRSAALARLRRHFEVRETA